MATQPHYSDWQWSIQHERYFAYLYDANGQIAEVLWQGTTRANIDHPVETSPSGEQTVDVRVPRTNPVHFHLGAQSAGPAADISSPSQIVGAGYTPTTTHRTPTSPAYTHIAPEIYHNAYQTPNSQQVNVARANIPASASHGTGSTSHYPTSTNYPDARANIASLPDDVQRSLHNRAQRFIRTGIDFENTEVLDRRYRRVAVDSHPSFFVLGRVFKMLWIEPAGQENPGQTRGSTHFSTVRYGERAFCEIRRFLVVSNRGTFSQCIPIQTYRGQGATKRGIIMQDHGVIHTSARAPDLVPGEVLTKYSIQVVPTASEHLEPASRVNYGKPYAVEHNVKVLDVGMVLEGHRYLITAYFRSAMDV